ncbi:MAG: hypothetical protein ACRDWT_20100 [Jatrophihabitantaceae bacterium]
MDPVIAFENQRLDPDATSWVNLGFWCPQSRVAAVVPDAATVRDQVLRLLPRVGIGTTGSPATLVNVQTIVWADTPVRRSLGTVRVVGRPVWLRLGFAKANWAFGDGQRASNVGPGKVYDRHGDRCARVLCPHYFGHVYRAAGPVTITLTVSWRASYSLDGIHYAAVDPDPLSGPAATQALLVRQARAVLVPNPDSN